MKQIQKRRIGIVLLLAFVLWTILIQAVDVQNIGVNGTRIGLASFNTWFHAFTGVHFFLYSITDWLGLIPIFVCMFFGLLGLSQLLKRRRLSRVDADILQLGLYYAAVIAAYLLFEMLPINYRPVLLDGCMESSYPSSTTLLVLSVMPTLAAQADRRCRNIALQRFISAFVVLFCSFMTIGRLLSGVHWFSDILGGFLLSMGLFMVYWSLEEHPD